MKCALKVEQEFLRRTLKYQTASSINIGYFIFSDTRINYMGIKTEGYS